MRWARVGGMRYGLLGDIHGNLEGLQAVVAALDSERVDSFLCLGDVVGYGADPNACCALVRELDAVCLFGNHDQAALGMVDLTWFNVYARDAAEWTQHQLAPEHKEWLAALPPARIINGFVVVHSSLPNPWKWIYVSTPSLAAETMAACEHSLVFLGHTHVAEAYRKVGGAVVRRRPLTDGGHIDLNTGDRWVINPGSCGQPRDRNPLAAYAVYDEEAGTVEVRRVAYDIDTAVDKIRQSDLPDFLGLRLYYGR